MRFIFAYLTVFILGIFAVIGMEGLLFDKLTLELIFAAILFAAPSIFVGATIAEIYYGFSKKATLARFAMYGLIYGVLITVVVLGILQLATTLMIILLSALGGIIATSLSVIFFIFRGGYSHSGKAASSK
ncbi:hypothetical protein [Listeria sp. PSOL-1]|uniref:hypothetical protein n=1 Tax=Listeria sp. PSOL-1 TaxID=1844999 RepID=UPI0013D8607A|nr:hypothetical protein [Listeria sp. PSOL-1]